MKPAISLLILWMVVSPAWAQQEDAITEPETTERGRYHHEFSLGAGALSAPDMFALYTNASGSSNEDATADIQMPVVYFEYSYYFGKHILASLHAGYQRFGVTYLESDGRTTRASFEDEFYTGMLGIKWYYISDFIFEMYSGGQAGVSVRESTLISGSGDTEQQQLFAFHATILGLRLGGPLAVTLEAGFGYKGIINAGVHLRL